MNNAREQKVDVTYPLSERSEAEIGLASAAASSSGETVVSSETFSSNIATVKCLDRAD